MSGLTNGPVDFILVTSVGLVGSSTGTGKAAMLTATQARTLLSVYTTIEVDTLLDGKADLSHSHAASDITSGTIATARLGSGTADATTYLRGDQTWQTIASGAAWGSITGTLSSQTDLQAALDAKASLSGAAFTGNISSTGTTWTLRAGSGKQLSVIASDTEIAWQSFGSVPFTFQALGGGEVTFGTTVNFTAGVGNLGDSVSFGGGSGGGAGGFKYTKDAAAAKLQSYGGVPIEINGAGNRVNVMSGLTVAGTTVIGGYAFASVPSASSNTGALIRITDRSHRLAYSDGTNWKFVADDVVIS